MTKFFRWVSTLVVGMLGSGTIQAVAQTNITQEQRIEYGRQFMASPQERRILLEAQENRVALPKDLPLRLREFLESSWSYKGLVANKTPELGFLLIWNEIALQAIALDHTNPHQNDPKDPPPPYFGEQFGPPRTSRVLAIVHLAIFEAVNTISPKYQSYKNVHGTILNGLTGPEKVYLSTLTGSPDLAKDAKNRAIVEAAYQTLVNLYPKKKDLLDIALELTLEKFKDPNAPQIALGAKAGAAAAKAILDLRHFDGSELPDLSSTDFASENPRTWHQDPISKLLPALGGNWPHVKPFLIPSADAFRSENLPGPPADGDPAFIAAYKRTKLLGGDPNANTADGDRRPTPTNRTGAMDPNKPIPPAPADPNDDQTFVGIFWAYDASAYLCAPPRLYNMIATSVALREKPIEHVEDFSLYLAYINVTLADAGLAAWDGKYHFLFPRPVTYLRAVKADDTPEGSCDPLWTPLGAQATNSTRKNGNFSPNFPAYPSGHATFGGALFQAMLLYFKSTDPRFPDHGIAFDFVSDEFNGLNYGPGPGPPAQKPRERVVAHFGSFKEAERLNADSRIYLGVHWQFDADDGVRLGNAVANDTFKKFVKPLPK
jgi:PAP2 superfamily